MGAVVKIVLVTGSRHHGDRGLIWNRLTVGEYRMVIHGDAPGADSIAGSWARGCGFVEVPVPYLKCLGKRGGPVRNIAMVQMAVALRRRGHSVSVEAFPLPGSRGTWQCIEEAQKEMLAVSVTEHGSTPK